MELWSFFSSGASGFELLGADARCLGVSYEDCGYFAIRKGRPRVGAPMLRGHTGPPLRLRTRGFLAIFIRDGGPQDHGKLVVIFASPHPSPRRKEPRKFENGIRAVVFRAAIS